ncbi:serine/threonine-protein kinase [Botrimarina colliarenosi]|uniref:serine/threonine-protein kinase n=1 Tax=Botrimarina colliarenosi TaxID=2528001 RepID=UPI0018D4A120|nr:serine/threonine-protein kinase [Botrimarina colliarenosi]
MHTQIAVELVRVDLERSWECGCPRRLSEYRAVAPQLFAEPDLLSDAAFEEYRLRRQAGEQVLPEEYESLYGVSTSGWPHVEDLDSADNFDSTTPEVAAYPEPGEGFAGFRLVRELGRGAFARVFLAEQNDLARRLVVLKVSQRRSLEPEHLARLQHTNIVPIYSVHEAGGLIGVCMPYCGERTLSEHSGGPTADGALKSTVARGKEETVRITPDKKQEVKEEAATRTDRTPLAIEAAVELVRDMARGLAHAHDRGIIHRDLKPANVLLADDGRPMLLDFNLSDGVLAYGEASLTVGGTLPYMAPEHLDAVLTGRRVDERCDIYSLGVILYELLAGQRPFKEHRGALESVVEASASERRRGAAPLRTTAQGVPPSLDAVVARCLAADPADRYATASDLADDLTRHLLHLPLQHTPNPSWSERFAKWRRRHPRWTSAGPVAAAGLLFAALFAGLWLAVGERVARLEAESHYDDFKASLEGARLSLSVPSIDHELLREGIELGTATLRTYVGQGTEDWRRVPDYRRLPDATRISLHGELAELAFLLARAETMLAHVPPGDAGLLSAALEHNSLACLLLGSNSEALAQQRTEIVGAHGRDAPAPPYEGLGHESLVDAYLQAQSLLSDGDHAGAGAVLEGLRSQQPNDPVVWLLLGNAQAGLTRLADAEAAFSGAIALQPASYLANYNRGLCRMQRGRFDAAVEDFNAVLQLRPHLTCALLNRAIAHEANGELQRAIDDLTTAIATDDAPPRAYLLRARLHRRVGDEEQARIDLAAGLAGTPVDEAGWVARGIARLANDPEAALADFRQALVLSPDSASALRNVVHVAADRLLRPDEAMAALNTLIDANPSDGAALAGRAVLHARMGRQQQSRDDVRRVVATNKEPLVLFQVACALSLTSKAENKDGAQALALLSRAVDADHKLLARAAYDPDLAAVRKLPAYSKLVQAHRGMARTRREIQTEAAQAAAGD